MTGAKGSALSGMLLMLLATWLVPVSGAGQTLLARKANSAVIGSSFDEVARVSEGSQSQTTHLREWLTIPLAGEFLDSRILSYNFVLRPTFSQRGDLSLPRNINSRTLDSTASFRILSAKPLSLLLDFGRTSGSTSGGFGTNGEFVNGSATTVLTWSNFALPMSLRRATRQSESSSVIGASMVPYFLSYDTTTTRFAANNSKLTVNAGSYRYEDRLGSSDYTTRDFSANHTARWGHESTLNSEYTWLEQSDRKLHIRSSWRERLRINHTERARGTYIFRRTATHNGTGRSAARQLSGRLEVQVARAVRLGLAGTTRTSTFSGGSLRTDNFGPRLSLNLGLPLRARLHASGSLDRQFRQRSGSSIAVEIANRAARVNTDGTLMINDPGVDTTTVVIRNEDQNIVFERGLDYELVAIGGLLEIRSLAGGRFEPGQTVFLNYRYEAVIDGGENVLLSRYSVGLQIGGLALRHASSRRSVSEDDPLTATITGASDNTATGASYFGRSGFGSLRIDLDRRSRYSEDINYLIHEGQVAWSLAPVQGTVFGLAFSGRETKEQTTTLHSVFVQPSASWTPSRKFSMQVRPGYQRWNQTDGISDTIWTAQLDATWRIADLEIRGRYSRETRVQKETVTGSRFFVRMERRF